MKQHKPQAKLIGSDGNIFNLMGIASKALKQAGLHEEANTMNKRIMSSNSYEEALSILTEYVEPIDVNQEYDDQSQYDDMEML